MALYLVTGATGKTGRHVVERLLTRGVGVRAMVHGLDTRSEALRTLGADIVEGDLCNPVDVRRATAGVVGAYFCYPPEDRLLEATRVFAKEAQEAGIKKVVNLSQYHARDAHPSPLTRQHWLGERALDAADIGATHLRANFFMEVYAIVCGASIARLNRFFLPYGEGAWAPVATDDIAKVVIEILTGTEEHLAEVIRVRGPEVMTQHEVAHIFSTVLGREIEYVSIPVDRWRAVARYQGLSEFLLDHQCHTAADVEGGKFAEVEDGVLTLVPPSATTFASFVSENAEAWRLASSFESRIQTFYSGRLFDPLNTRKGVTALKGVPSHGLPPSTTNFAREGVSLEGLTVQFDVVPGSSVFGDCLRVVDAPEEEPLETGFPPFGWSGEPILGGYAITGSSLSGTIELVFGREDNGFWPFELRHVGGLRGEDSVLAAPDGYVVPSVRNSVTDVEPRSHGRLEIRTGRVFDFHYNVAFYNSAIEKLALENPWLSPPALLFPGSPHAGHALAWMQFDGEHQLIFSIAAQQFLPLGPGPADSPLRLPASSSSSSHQSAFEARNTSLHPYLFLSARQSGGGPLARGDEMKSDALQTVDLGESAYRRVEGQTIRFVCLPLESNFGDDFALQSVDLGGAGLAQSPLFGDVVVQFGEVTGVHIPFVVSFEAPEKLRDRCRKPLQLLPPGTRPGLVGLYGELKFPNVTYTQHNLSLQSDPYKVSVGFVDIRRHCGPIVLRNYLFQDLMLSLLMTEPRTPTDSFAYVGMTRFVISGEGRMGMRLHAKFEIPYPAGYMFPLPDGQPTYVTRDSQLYPFVNLVCVEEGALQESVEAVEFLSRLHKRGHFEEGMRVTIRPQSSGGERLAVAVAGRVFEGVGHCRGQVAFGGRTFRVGEYELGDQQAGSGESCVCIITSGGGGESELQMISSKETFDTWAKGVCSFGPSARSARSVGGEYIRGIR